jgi:M6 family metalloprotease-like protein
MKPIVTFPRHAFWCFLSLVLVFSCKKPDETGTGECWCTTGINVQVIDDSGVPAAARDMIYSIPSGYNAVGTDNYSAVKKLIVIRYEFATEYPRNPNVTADLVRQDFFSTGTQSVREYFRENSYGQFDIVEGAIPDWVTLSYDVAHYADLAPLHDWPSCPELHQELCQKAQVDWSAIDANGDHIISPKEAQICFLSSVGRGGCNRYSDFVIATNSGDYRIAHSFALFDSKRANEADSHIDAIAYNYGTIWHELCHAIFGLPDRYKDICGSGTTGSYDIMSDPCRWQKMNMFDKMKLGWVRPRILEKAIHRPGGERHCYLFPSSETNPAAAVLLDRDRTDQYWVVENRNISDSPREFDKGFPESGLVVWWVDATNNKVYLVDAHDPMKHPQTIMYSGGPVYLGATFKGDTCSGSSIYTTYLSSSSGDLSFLMRAVSPPGPNMFVEF